MGSKIRPPGTSMGPFFSKTWYFDGSIFQNFLKFAPKWRKFGTLIGQLFKIFRNLRQNGANFSEKFWFLVHGWVTFPSKWVHGWVAFQKSQRHTPTQTKVEYPPRAKNPQLQEGIPGVITLWVLPIIFSGRPIYFIIVSPIYRDFYAQKFLSCIALVARSPFLAMLSILRPRIDLIAEKLATLHKFGICNARRCKIWEVEVLASISSRLGAVGHLRVSFMRENQPSVHKIERFLSFAGLVSVNIFFDKAYWT